MSRFLIVVVKSVNLECVVDLPFPTGALVKTKNLTRTQNHGKLGVVTDYDHSKKRVIVQLLDEKSRSLSVTAQKLTLIEEVE